MSPQPAEMYYQLPPPAKVSPPPSQRAGSPPPMSPFHAFVPMVPMAAEAHRAAVHSSSAALAATVTRQEYLANQNQALTNEVPPSEATQCIPTL